MFLRFLPLLILCLGMFLMPMAVQADHAPLHKGNRPLQLLQSPDGNQQLQPKPQLGNFFDYVNSWWPLVLGSAAGIAVLHGIVGGIQIIVGGSPEKAAEGKERILWSLVGIVITLLAGFFLKSLNSVFFT